MPSTIDNLCHYHRSHSLAVRCPEGGRAAPSCDRTPFFSEVFFIFLESEHALIPPSKFFATPSISVRPHSSDPGAHKEPARRQLMSERCHSPSHTALSKLTFTCLCSTARRSDC